MPSPSSTSSSRGRGILSETIWNRWRGLAERDPDRECLVWTKADGSSLRYTYAALLSGGAAFARRLRDEGVRPGNVCALIIRHRSELYPLYAGIEALGAIPAILAYPNPRLHAEKFRDGLRGMAARSGLDWILTERELEPAVGGLVSGPGSSVRGLLFPLEWQPEPEPPDWTSRLDQRGGGDQPALLQHSSGTTGLQKAVVLSHRAVLEHARVYGRAIGLSRADRVVSWLPLYHDMGLIAAFHVPLASAVPTVQIDPFEWVLAPDLLLRWISDESGTVSWLPNFAYNLLAERVHEEDLEGVRLDSIRLLVNCSEPVRHESHERFARRFEPYGLDRRVLSACYAMAETTFAVTQTAPGVEAKSLAVDQAALAAGQVRRSSDPGAGRKVVASGTPIGGCEIAIFDDDGNGSEPDRVGEVCIRSTSLFDGYRNWPEKTAEAFRDRWYRSGDLGFVADGELFVVGRKKDLIIVAGKNIYPEDVEDAVSGVDGVIPGRVVAMALNDEELGTEQVGVIAETTLTGAEERAGLRSRIVAAAMGIDVALSEVFFAPPRWLVKSSAGKPARGANRVRLGELAARAQEAVR